MPDFEIICVGAAKFDVIAEVEDFPHQDERVLAQNLMDAIGGPAVTAAVAIARLGVPVAFCGVIGRDRGGDHIMERLEQERIGTKWVTRSADVETGRSMNIVTRRNATRAIITMPAPPPDPAVVAALKARWIHFDDVGYGSGGALRRIAPSGVKFSLDGGNHIRSLDIRGIDLYAPTILRLATDYSSNGAPRELMQTAIDHGARNVVATDGANGSYVLSDGAFDCVPAFKTADIVSTLGAGDVFHGGILAALCLGKSLTEATRWGNACAALSCRALDGMTMAPTRHEVEDLLATERRDVNDNRIRSNV
jgi:sulfofructose kinase